MASPTEQEATISLGAGLLHAEFFRVGGPDGPLLARIATAAGAAMYVSPARNAVHTMPRPDPLDRLTDALLGSHISAPP